VLLLDDFIIDKIRQELRNLRLLYLFLFFSRLSTDLTSPLQGALPSLLSEKARMNPGSIFC